MSTTEGEAWDETAKWEILGSFSHQSEVMTGTDDEVWLSTESLLFRILFYFIFVESSVICLLGLFIGLQHCYLHNNVEIAAFIVEPQLFTMKLSCYILNHYVTRRLLFVLFLPVCVINDTNKAHNRLFHIRSIKSAAATFVGQSLISLCASS